MTHQEFEEKIQKLLERNQASNTTMNEPEKKYNCPLCQDHGYTVTRDEKDPSNLIYKECQCAKKKRALLILKKSGLEAQSKKCTLDNFIADNDRARNLLDHARSFLDDEGKWFFVSGIPGSGKTHICTAVAVELINRGNYVYYARWREIITKLKMLLANDYYEYKGLMDRLKKADVLYLDDFFKGSVTDSDISHAFELLDYRYLQPDCRTIISTEYSMPELREIDDAIARRIFERSKGYCCASPDRNYSFTR